MIKDFYKILTVGVMFAGLNACSPSGGNADLSISKGANGARDTLLFHTHTKDTVEKFLILKDTLKIQAGAHDLTLEEDVFNGGFLFQGTSADGKNVVNAHYDIDQTNLNATMSQTYIHGFTWNETCCGRNMYLNYVPR